MAQKTAIVQRVIPLSSADEWNRALSGIPHSFFHTWEHSYAMHLTHKLPAYLYCAESAGVRVVCPFIERPIGNYVDIATPYGFSGFAGNGDLPELPSYWDQFVRSRGYISVFLNLHPLFSSANYSDPNTLFEQKDLYIFDANSSIEDLFKRWPRDRRREIRRWKERAKLYTNRNELAAFALAHCSEFFRWKNASEAYDFSPQTMEFLLEQECLFLLGTGMDSQIEAVMVIAATRDCAEALFYFAPPGDHRYNTGLIWSALGEVQSHGIPYLNFGGGLSRNDKLAKFKSHFGAVPRMCYAVKQVVDQERYAELCLRCDADAETREGYFPAYRAPARNSAAHA